MASRSFLFLVSFSPQFLLVFIQSFFLLQGDLFRLLVVSLSILLHVIIFQPQLMFIFFLLVELTPSFIPRFQSHPFDADRTC